MDGVRRLGGSKRQKLLELSDSENEVEKEDKINRIIETTKMAKRTDKEKLTFKERVQLAM